MIYVHLKTNTPEELVTLHNTSYQTINIFNVNQFTIYKSALNKLCCIYRKIDCYYVNIKDRRIQFGTLIVKREIE